MCGVIVDTWTLQFHCGRLLNEILWQIDQLRFQTFADSRALQGFSIMARNATRMLWLLDDPIKYLETYSEDYAGASLQDIDCLTYRELGQPVISIRAYSIFLQTFEFPVPLDPVQLENLGEIERLTSEILQIKLCLCDVAILG